MENKRTLLYDPQYFGVYLNMARHNVFLIQKHIDEKLKLKNAKAEENLADSFLCKDEIIENKGAYLNLLKRFLPISKAFDTDLLDDEMKKITPWNGINYSELASCFKHCTENLHEFRNSYTHYYIGKERKYKFDPSLLERLFKIAVSFTKKRFRNVFSEEDFILSENIKLFDENYNISEKGLAFFICSFLEREYAFLFINKITGFKNTTTNEFRATREVFCAFCVTLPHDKLISDDPKQAYILDILNELNRCPQELFDNLTDEGKKELKTEGDDEEKAESILIGKVRSRNNDRFTYFALRYLDEYCGYNFHINLGPIELKKYEKVFLGDKVERVLEKDIKLFGKLSDFEKGEEEVKRKIKIPENIYFRNFHPHYHIEKNKIGISFKQTEENVLIETEKNGEKSFKTLLSIPDCFISVHELPKIVMLELLKKDESKKVIQKFCKNNDEKIFNAEYINAIKEKLNFEKPFNKSFQKKNMNAYTENGLEILRERKEKLNNLLKKDGLNEKQIPERLVNYWLNINPVAKDKSIQNLIKAMLKDCKEKLKAVKENKAPKIGKMASYLSRDITDMITEEAVKNKLTSFSFNKMQEFIALFEAEKNKSKFISLCENLDLLNESDKKHPFLYNVNIKDIKYTSDFYKKYLEEKQKWIENTFYKKGKDEKGKFITKIIIPADINTIPFSLRNIVKPKIQKSGFEQWLKNVSKNENGVRGKAIDLPTDLFDKTVKGLLNTGISQKNEDKKAPDKKTDWKDKLKQAGTENNFSKLLSIYLEGDTQHFYNLKRKYVIKRENDIEGVGIEFDLKPEGKFKDFLTSAIKKKLSEARCMRNKDNKKLRHNASDEQINNTRQFNNNITENEKVIRFHQTKDRVLIEIVNKLLEGGTGQRIELKNFHPSSPVNPLNEEVVVTQKVKDKKIISTRKRKRYSDFRKFVYDTRIPALLEYYDEVEIEFDILKKELEDYNKYRESAFDKIFGLEESSIAKAGENNINEKLKPQEKGYIEHKTYLDWLKDNEKIIDEKLYEFMRVVRNKYSHNEFHPKDIIENFIEEGFENISEKIYKRYEEEINGVLEKLKD
ncbi:MAG: type VI-B CRISPR-associated RNA-guided ribonuclease Cas13b [Ignavibacteria bacterium]|nr:type VI-B CRISPR-associated RNA-guided ribonuclease Cas13b [Ignavibacteria bacterium]